MQIFMRLAILRSALKYIGKQVWARWDSVMVRVFDVKMQPITSHPTLERETGW